MVKIEVVTHSKTISTDDTIRVKLDHASTEADLIAMSRSDLKELSGDLV